MKLWMVTTAAALALSANCSYAQIKGEQPNDSMDQGTPFRAYEIAEAVLPQHIGELIFDMSVKPQWFDDSSKFWYERNTPEGYRYLLVDADQDKNVDLFDHDVVRSKLSHILGRTIEAKEFRLRGAKLSKQDEHIEFDFEKRRFFLDIASQQIGEIEKSNSGSLSPDGKLRAFVRDHDLWAIDVVSGKEFRLTHDGTALRPYARPVVNVKRKIAEGSNEPDLDPDIEWSPDSKKIATYQLDLSNTRRLALVQSTPPEGAPPKVFEYHYSLTGDKNVATSKDVIIDVPSAKVTVSSNAPRHILYYGGPSYEWSKDSEAVFTISPGRGYKILTLQRIEAETGNVTTLRQDKSDTYVDYYGHFWSYDEDRNRHFWTADPTGYAHIYTADGKSGKGKQLTSGSWRARSVAGTSADGNLAYVVGSGKEAGRDPYYRSLYSVRLTDGKLLNLTPEPVDHDVSVSPDGRYFVDNMSRIDMPTQTVLRDAATGKIVRKLQEADITKFSAAGYSLPEPFEATAADGVTKIYGAMFKPADFDPSRRYPVIENVYTGPHYVQTPKSFEAALTGRNILSMSQLGAIGVTIDGRGTWGRSRSFQQPAYKNLHNVGLDDHIAGIRELARRHPWIDANNVGIYGFSAGGYDVVRAMTRHPEFYKVGVSASGNHDNRLDKATWNEQWMGVELGSLYDENSNVIWANKLKGKLFVAHGELDENVPMAATIRLVDALIAANKDFEFLVVPNADHYLDSSPYFHRRRFDFFTTELIDQAKPNAYVMRDFDN